VYSIIEKFPFGYIGSFNSDEFIDVDEEVVVWLTEGPTRPIYEAIEILEKMQRLPVGDEKWEF
jgi:hypothetical protein